MFSLPSITLGFTLGAGTESDSFWRYLDPWNGATNYGHFIQIELFVWLIMDAVSNFYNQILSLIHMKY